MTDIVRWDDTIKRFSVSVIDVVFPAGSDQKRLARELGDIIGEAVAMQGIEGVPFNHAECHKLIIKAVDDYLVRKNVAIKGAQAVQLQGLADGCVTGLEQLARDANGMPERVRDVLDTFAEIVIKNYQPLPPAETQKAAAELSRSFEGTLSIARVSWKPGTFDNKAFIDTLVGAALVHLDTYDIDLAIRQETEFRRLLGVYATVIERSLNSDAFQSEREAPAERAAAQLSDTIELAVVPVISAYLQRQELRAENGRPYTDDAITQLAKDLATEFHGAMGEQGLRQLNDAANMKRFNASVYKVSGDNTLLKAMCADEKFGEVAGLLYHATKGAIETLSVGQDEGVTIVRESRRY